MDGVTYCDLTEQSGHALPNNETSKTGMNGSWLQHPGMVRKVEQHNKMNV